VGFRARGCLRVDWALVFFSIRAIFLSPFLLLSYGAYRIVVCPQQSLTVLALTRLLLLHPPGAASLVESAADDGDQGDGDEDEVEEDAPQQQGSAAELSDADVRRRQLEEALLLQMEMQKKLHEQLEAQRQLQLSLEQHGKYITSLLQRSNLQEGLPQALATNPEAKVALAALGGLPAWEQQQQQQQPLVSGSEAPSTVAHATGSAQLTLPTAGSEPEGNVQPAASGAGAVQEAVMVPDTKRQRIG
jgi:hypothetical protein